MIENRIVKTELIKWTYAREKKNNTNTRNVLGIVY
jgi:hypothetical protein